MTLNLKLLLFNVFVFIIIYGNNAICADFYKSAKDPISKDLNICEKEILIYGDIEEGDANEFIGLVQEINREGCLVGKVSILSHGGEVFESMRIGSVIRENLISTEAPNYEDGPFYKASGIDFCLRCNSIKNTFPEAGPCLVENWGRDNNPKICACNSACFLIWASGVVRLGSGIGLHRPNFSKNYFRNLSATDAKNKYNELSNNVKEFLISMDIPTKVIDEMFTHSSEEIYYLANSYERDSFGSIPVLKYPPFFEEWMVSKCKSHLNDEEFELLNNLSMKSAQNNLTTIEKYALDGLYTKSKKSRECLNSAKMEIQLRKTK